MKTTCAAALSLIILLYVLSSSFGYGQNVNRRFQITPYVNFKGYSWKEFSDKGDEDLSESGLLYSFGGIPRYAFTKDMRFYADADLQFYAGTTSYSGFKFNLQTGERTPFSTDVGYFGFAMDVSSGYDFQVSKSDNLTPIAGFGFEYWSRDIGKGTQGGYVEKYTTFSINVGVKETYILNRNIRFNSTLLLKIPLSISESVDLSTVGDRSDISLGPGKNPRFSIQAGGSFYNVFAELYFVTWTLSKSNPDGQFLQPESSRKNYGLRVGYTIAVL